MKFKLRNKYKIILEIESVLDTRAISARFETAMYANVISLNNFSNFFPNQIYNVSIGLKNQNRPTSWNDQVLKYSNLESFPLFEFQGEKRV